MSKSRDIHHSDADPGSCISHSRLHVVVTGYHFLSPSVRHLPMTCFPTTSITSSGSERSPAMVLSCTLWKQQCKGSLHIPEVLAR